MGSTPAPARAGAFEVSGVIIRRDATIVNATLHLSTLRYNCYKTVADCNRRRATGWEVQGVAVGEAGRGLSFSHPLLC